MALRRDNPARSSVSAAKIDESITAADLEHAQAAWRKHAPRKYWGLLNAKRQQPETKSDAS